MPITVRPASISDKPRIFALYTEAMKDHIESIWGWDAVWQENDFKKTFNSASTFIIECDSGFAGYYQVEFPERGTEYLRMMIVRQDLRSRGIGRQIIELLQKEARENDNTVKLRVFNINSNAKRFYLKHGWSVTAEETGFDVMERRP